jgi:Leucine-rich repeat (LRR) protein
MEKIEISGKQFPLDSESLNLSNLGLTEIPDLSAFTALKKLDLYCNKITRINTFHAPALEYLNLSSNAIEKIENLSCFPNLKTLQVGNNKLSKIENIESLVSIRSVALRGNQIQQIEALPPHIEELFLCENNIHEIPDLTSYPKLFKLYLEQNHISSFSFDLLPRELLILYLTKNDIRELQKPHVEHNYIDTLGLIDNPIEKLEWIECLPQMESVSITGKTLKRISKETYEEIRRKQQNEKITHKPFFLFTSMTTTRKIVEDFVTRNKRIKIV